MTTSDAAESDTHALVHLMAGPPTTRSGVEGFTAGHGLARGLVRAEPGRCAAEFAATNMVATESAAQRRRRVVHALPRRSARRGHA
jgi:hypothetical protein